GRRVLAAGLAPFARDMGNLAVVQLQRHVAAGVVDFLADRLDQGIIRVQHRVREKDFQPVVVAVAGATAQREGEILAHDDVLLSCLAARAALLSKNIRPGCVLAPVGADLPATESGTQPLQKPPALRAGSRADTLPQTAAPTGVFPARCWRRSRRAGLYPVR